MKKKNNNNIRLWNENLSEKNQLFEKFASYEYRFTGVGIEDGQEKKHLHKKRLGMATNTSYLF